MVTLFLLGLTRHHRGQLSSVARLVLDCYIEARRFGVVSRTFILDWTIGKKEQVSRERGSGDQGKLM